MLPYRCTHVTWTEPTIYYTIYFFLRDIVSTTRTRTVYSTPITPTGNGISRWYPVPGTYRHLYMKATFIPYCTYRNALLCVVLSREIKCYENMGDRRTD
jgi:hypothetical protein